MPAKVKEDSEEILSSQQVLGGVKNRKPTKEVKEFIKVFNKISDILGAAKYTKESITRSIRGSEEQYLQQYITEAMDFIHVMDHQIQEKTASYPANKPKTRLGAMMERLKELAHAITSPREAKEKRVVKSYVELLQKKTALERSMGPRVGTNLRDARMQ